jgi:3-phosphoshikimate 1-carboxyvinyltransferase
VRLNVNSAVLTVTRAPIIHAEIQVPGDKSISHRAAMFASLSNGVCVLRGYSPGEDCQNTIKAMRQLGVQIDQPEAEPSTFVVHGRYRKLSAPRGNIDCGNSGTTMRLLAGLLAGQSFRSRLIGDKSLSIRPMNRVITPLTAMGARITAEGEGGRAPLVIDGGPLQAIDYVSPVASAQIKSAILLAGLYAEGTPLLDDDGVPILNADGTPKLMPTSVTEPVQSRDHTERMLNYFLVKVESGKVNTGDAAFLHPQDQPNRVSIHGGQMPESRAFNIPGDISSAAFWLAAAAAQPGARLLVKNLGLNATRTGLLAVLLRMGARVHEIVEDVEQIEPSGTVMVEGERLRGTVIEGREIPNVIDELPIIAVLGALAEGETVIRNAAELRVKETDRLAALAANLRAMGAPVEEFHDGLTITGGHPLHGARLPSHGDHRIAMAFAIAGLFAEGETVIEGVECIETSYPGFQDTLQQIIAASTSGAPLTPVISDARQFLPKG